MREDVGADLLRGRAPARLELGVAADLGELRRPVERDPAHELRGDVVLRLAARLPDALVGFRQTFVAHSACASTIGHRRAAAAGSGACGAGSSRARRRRRRSGAGRRRRCRSAPGGRRRSPRGRRSVDSVRSRRPSIPYMICSEPSSVRLDVGDELHELVGLPVEVQAVQRLEREGRVAHPRVAVVPVALAARRLGQRRRERRDRRAGRHVGQALDRERRALDRVAPAVVGDARPAEPGAPEADGRRDPASASSTSAGPASSSAHDRAQ